MSSSKQWRKWDFAVCWKDPLKQLEKEVNRGIAASESSLWLLWRWGVPINGGIEIIRFAGKSPANKSSDWWIWGQALLVGGTAEDQFNTCKWSFFSLTTTSSVSSLVPKQTCRCDKKKMDTIAKLGMEKKDKMLFYYCSFIFKAMTLLTLYLLCALTATGQRPHLKSKLIYGIAMTSILLPLRSWFTIFISTRLLAAYMNMWKHLFQHRHSILRTSSPQCPQHCCESW